MACQVSLSVSCPNVVVHGKKRVKLWDRLFEQGNCCTIITLENVKQRLDSTRVATDEVVTLLNVYRLFPYRRFYRWLSYGKPDKE